MKGRKTREAPKDARKRGGAAPVEDAGGNPAVIKEAKGAKSIGKIGGMKPLARGDRKRGGAAKHEARESKSYEDAEERKCGGAVKRRADGGGADSNPYSSAGKQLRN